MDVAKIVAVLMSNDVTLRELLNKAPIARRGIPTLMIPTTAGTGSEATPNSIFLVPEDELKVGIVSPRLLPDCVILDPKMTIGLPPAITASTGMDALTHAIECYMSKKGNPFSELFALKAIALISRSIRRAFSEGGDLDARHDMLLGALYGGMCIATSSTTAVHALAYPLGGKYRIAHGVSNAILLPYVMRFNGVGNEEKFRDVAIAMGIDVAGLSAAEAATAFIDSLFALNRDLAIPADLKRWNITAADLETLVDGAAKVTRLLDNNPRPMSRADIAAIYTQLI
jgi:alcohol dehydrogenase class IV